MVWCPLCVWVFPGLLTFPHAPHDVLLLCSSLTTVCLCVCVRSQAAETEEKEMEKIVKLSIKVRCRRDA